MHSKTNVRAILEQIWDAVNQSGYGLGPMLVHDDQSWSNIFRKFTALLLEIEYIIIEDGVGAFLSLSSLAPLEVS